MAVVVSMLRGINVGGHNKIKMEALRMLLSKDLVSGPMLFYAHTTN